MLKLVAKGVLALALLCSFVGSAVVARQANDCKVGQGTCSMRTCSDFCFTQGAICTCAQ